MREKSETQLLKICTQKKIPLTKKYKIIYIQTISQNTRFRVLATLGTI